MYEDIYFRVRDIEEDVSSSTDEQLYDNSQEEEESGSDSFQSCEDEELLNENRPSLKLFSQLFNQIIDKIKLKSQNNEIKQTEHVMFFGYPVTILDINDMQDVEMNRAELEAEFYDVIQACEIITED